MRRGFLLHLKGKNYYIVENDISDRFTSFIDYTDDLDGYINWLYNTYICNYMDEDDLKYKLKDKKATIIYMNLKMQNGAEEDFIYGSEYAQAADI